MKINDKGLELIKEFEGCELKAYRDIVGVVTIGYGHTGPAAKMGTEITLAEAESLLYKDMEVFERGVERCLKTKVNNNQFSAMVCLAYNIGLGNFKISTLLKKINAGDFKGAALEFERWDKAGGSRVAGLTRRRKAERKLFES